jgi:cytochrome b561
MDMDNAAVFLAGSILYALAFIIILIAFVVANNIIHKFWKNFGWTFTPHWFHEQPRFASQEELDRVAPHMEHNYAKKETSKKV